MICPFCFSNLIFIHFFHLSSHCVSSNMPNSFLFWGLCTSFPLHLGYSEPGTSHGPLSTFTQVSVMHHLLSVVILGLGTSGPHFFHWPPPDPMLCSFLIIVLPLPTLHHIILAHVRFRRKGNLLAFFTALSPELRGMAGA